MPVLNCLFKALNPSINTVTFTRSPISNVRESRASRLYSDPIDKLFTPTNGARAQPPDPLTELVYNIETPVNCCPTVRTRGVCGSEEATVKMPESRQPFTR